MGVKERKARQKRFLRQEILDAASELFVKDGYENVSMRRIADRIEYSPTTIYLYFKDKAELLDQVCQETFSRLSQALARNESQPGDPIARLKRGLLIYIQFGVENPQHYKATFMVSWPEFYAEKQHRPDAPSVQAFDFLRRAVQDCIRSGKFPARSDAELVSQTLWAGVHGVTSLLVTCKYFPWVGKSKLIHSVVDSLVVGVSVQEI